MPEAMQDCSSSSNAAAAAAPPASLGAAVSGLELAATAPPPARVLQLRGKGRGALVPAAVPYRILTGERLYVELLAGARIDGDITAVRVFDVGGAGPPVELSIHVPYNDEDGLPLEGTYTLGERIWRNRAGITGDTFECPKGVRKSVERGEGVLSGCSRFSFKTPPNCGPYAGRACRIVFYHGPAGAPPQPLVALGPCTFKSPKKAAAPRREGGAPFPQAVSPSSPSPSASSGAPAPSQAAQESAALAGAGRGNGRKRRGGAGGGRGRGRGAARGAGRRKRRKEEEAEEEEEEEESAESDSGCPTRRRRKGGVRGLGVRGRGGRGRGAGPAPRRPPPRAGAAAPTPRRRGAGAGGRGRGRGAKKAGRRACTGARGEPAPHAAEAAGRVAAAAEAVERGTSEEEGRRAARTRPRGRPCGATDPERKRTTTVARRSAGGRRPAVPPSAPPLPVSRRGALPVHLARARPPRSSGPGALAALLASRNEGFGTAGGGASPAAASSPTGPRLAAVALDVWGPLATGRRRPAPPPSGAPRAPASFSAEQFPATMGGLPGAFSAPLHQPAPAPRPDPAPPFPIEAAAALGRPGSPWGLGPNLGLPEAGALDLPPPSPYLEGLDEAVPLRMPFGTGLSRAAQMQLELVYMSGGAPGLAGARGLP
eukprot:tig00000615_g2552.t1